jgi:hypothetical protein
VRNMSKMDMELRHQTQRNAISRVIIKAQLSNIVKKR